MYYLPGSNQKNVLLRHGLDRVRTVATASRVTSAKLGLVIAAHRDDLAGLGEADGVP